MNVSTGWYSIQVECKGKSSTTATPIIALSRLTVAESFLNRTERNASGIAKTSMTVITLELMESYGSGFLR